MLFILNDNCKAITSNLYEFVSLDMDMLDIFFSKDLTGLDNVLHKNILQLWRCFVDNFTLAGRMNVCKR